MLLMLLLQTGFAAFWSSVFKMRVDMQKQDLPAAPTAYNFASSISLKQIGANGLHFGRTFCNSFAVLALTKLREEAGIEGQWRVRKWFADKPKLNLCTKTCRVTVAS
jgi:hypothetical protein